MLHALRWGVALGILLATPLVARAHEIVDEARARYEEAEFAAATEALDRAEAADDLDRADLVAALELRLLLGVANGDTAAVERDVQRLVAVDPEYAPSDELPPEVKAAIRAARDAAEGPLRVVAEATPDGDRARVEAYVEGDPASLTREVRVGARADQGDVEVGSSSVSIPIGGASAVFYFAEAVGPGGVVVASAGSRGAPLRLELDAAAVTPPSSGDGDEALLWGLVGGIGGAVLVAGAIVLAVVLVSEGGQSDRTRPTLPMVVMEE